MKHLAYLNRYILKYKWRILAGVFFVISANALNVYNPRITKDAVNVIAENLGKIRSTTNESALNSLKETIGAQVLWLFAKYLIVALLAGAFTFFMRQTIIVVSRMIEYDLKNEIYAHYQQLDLAFYRRNNTGDLMNRITEDVGRVRMYLGPAIMYSVNLFFTITFAVSSMLFINPTLTFWVLLPLPVLSFIIYYVSEKVERAGTEIQSKLSDLTTLAQETYSGIRVVQAYNREVEMEEFFSRESETYKDKQLHLARIDSVFFPSMTFLVGISVIFVVYIGGLQVGYGNLTPGDLVAFFMYTNMLMWPVSSLGWVASMIQRAAASQKRINELLNYQPTVKTGAIEAKNLRGEIVFNHVSFTYPDTGIKALQDVSFRINPGERIAIIGRTGSGKTTIADLLMRMYDVTKGEILVDGVNVQQYTLGSLRRQIGFVPQDVFLFSETIDENISFGLPEKDHELAKKYANYASIGSEIERFPEGYDTMIGERGVTLSGGQKQRISIARALIKQPDILVLDDSLSAVDTATEKEIQKNLDEVLYNKTAIIITHRIFSLIQFDNIIVLDGGCIAEFGKHDELLRKKGLYADIYDRQMQEQKREELVQGI